MFYLWKWKVTQLEVATDLVLNSSEVTINSDQLLDEKLFSNLNTCQKYLIWKPKSFGTYQLMLQLKLVQPVAAMSISIET